MAHQANTALRVTELDFDSIRNNLKTYLSSQNEFTDYDFEGSGMAVLLDILAYNTHYMGYYLNMVGNEMFIDSAQLRESIVSHAKSLNYVPGSMTAPTTFVKLVITPESGEDTTTTTLTLPKYTRFISEPVNGKNYIFTNLAANTATKSGGSFTFNNLQLRQGIPVTLQYTVSNENRFVIPSANVDIDTITVSVQESFSNTDTKTYTLTDDITLLKANSKSYFIEENSVRNGNYVVYFGDDIIGKKPANNNIVIINYLETHGDAANKANNFSKTGAISGYSQNVVVRSVSAAAGGGMKESIENIRFRAPVFYSIQNRAVTTSDYEALILRDYPSIQSISVWSGEDNDPPVYGKIFISIKPKENFAITNLEKERIKDDIIKTKSVLTVFPEIIEPDYTYITLATKVNYNKNQTTLSEDEIKQLTRTAIEDYYDDNLGTFSSTYRNSVVHAYMEKIGTYVLSTEVKEYLQKRVDITTGVLKNYEINFGVPLYRGDITSGLYTYPSINVLDSSGTEREMYIEEVPQSFTGIDSIRITNPGFNYTSTPTVTISGDGFGATASAKIVNGKINSIKVDSRGTGYTRATVSITGGGGISAAATAKLQLRYGDLRTYYYRDNGEKVIVNENIGTIDYELGLINIVNLQIESVTENDYYDENVLTFNIKQLYDTIYQSRNNILEIDFDDSRSITVETEQETLYNR